MLKSLKNKYYIRISVVDLVGINVHIVIFIIMKFETLIGFLSIFYLSQSTKPSPLQLALTHYPILSAIKIYRSLNLPK